MVVAVKQFYKKAPSQISDKVLNTPLIIISSNSCCRGAELYVLNL